MTNLNKLDRIPWEGGLSVYLWGIILAVLIGLETLAHCRWHHSLAGILGYVAGKGERSRNMQSSFSVSWLWMPHGKPCQTPAAFPSLPWGTITSPFSLKLFLLAFGYSNKDRSYDNQSTTIETLKRSLLRSRSSQAAVCLPSTASRLHSDTRTWGSQGTYKMAQCLLIIRCVP